MASAGMACAAMRVDGPTRSANPFYYAHWCGKSPPENLPSLDDGMCLKVFPSAIGAPVRRRGFSCPARFSGRRRTAKGFGPVSVRARDLPSALNTTAFPELDNRTNVAIILIRRGMGSDEPAVAYFGHSATEPYETWSSSKIFAGAHAAGSLRSACGEGLAANTTGKHGPTPYGDLLTIVCSYDRTAGYSSNALARYFLDIGGRPGLHQLVGQWFGWGNQSLGGDYGEPVPADLRYGEHQSSGRWCADGPNRTDDGSLVNSLSAVAAAEFFRRLVMHRESRPQLRVPRVDWADIETLFYGADEPAIFPPEELLWGGMTADTSIYLQRSLKSGRASPNSGQWRIFSKLGAGFSSSRGVGEVTNIAYGCFPSEEIDAGLELVVASRASVVGDNDLRKADALLQKTMNYVMSRIEDFD